MTTMATTVMASSTSKILARQPVTSAAKHRPCPAAIPMIVRMDITAASLRHKILRSLSGSAAAAAVVAAAVTPLPALAEQIEKAQLFDFNLTLPAIAIEFLLLMVALDKVYFTPLGNFMDERDAAIRAKLGDVKDTSSEVKELEEQAAAVMRAARAEVAAALNQMKKETAAELEAKLGEGRKQVEAELAEAVASLEKQKEETMKALDSQIAALSDEIVKKVLPGAT